MSGMQHLYQSCCLFLAQYTVPCSDGDICVADGDSQTYGQIEVCVSSMWGTVCGDQFWDSVDAGVVCRQLEFSQHGMLFSEILS